MTRDKALKKLQQVVDDLSGSRLPLATSIALALSPILASLSSPDCACGGKEPIATTKGFAIEGNPYTFSEKMHPVHVRRHEPSRWVPVVQLLLPAEEKPCS